ncbi:efflux transporter outer membrane subunit [Novosphingobium colocasiae]|nr:efflux transporter outer membrane subunit [Novosphingobium colocasiae]
MIDHGTPIMARIASPSPPLWLAASLLALALAGCTVGPDFKAPAPAAPQDWTEWHSGDAATPLPADLATDLRPDWWRNFGDPVLDELETRALAGSPDLETAALHFAQARVQQGAVSSQALPQVNASAGATRIRQSENGASTRLFDAIAGGNRDALAKFLSDPFTLYQGGFDAGWEPDLWGRVSRSIEAVGAQTQGKAALLDAARISIVGDVAQTYFELREQQRRIALARDLIATLTDQTALVRARMQGGAQNGIDLDQQSATLKQAEAQLPALIAAETAGRNRLTLLLGQHPGALDDLLRPRPAAELAPPALALGVPSDLARRRPDIRAAEAGLHAATAQVGVAVADLYPSIRIGGSFSLESFRQASLFDWASRSWAIGPSISLPIFDGGRRKRVVELRKLEQREAAVGYQKTVLQAWGEIDSALTAYAAERQTNASLKARAAATGDAHALVLARNRAGAVSSIEVGSAHAAWLQAQADLAQSDGRLARQYVAINKALGNGPTTANAPSP